MKRRIATGVTLLLFLTLLSLMGAYNLDCILSGRVRACSWNPMTAFSGLSNQKVRLFFFLFVALSTLFIIYMLFANSYIKYKSDMQRITPDIQTPRAEGQGQYGTARWMPQEKIDEMFTVVTVDSHSHYIRELCAQGDADLKADTIQIKEGQKGGHDI